MKEVKLMLKASYFVSGQNGPNYNIIMEFQANDMSTEDVNSMLRKFIDEAAIPEPATIRTKIKEVTRFLRLPKEGA